MKRSMSLGTPRSQRHSRAFAAIVVGSLFFVACGSDGSGSTETAAPSTDAPETSDAPANELPAPTGDEMIVGMVNTEGGAGGLDFPDIRRFVEASI